MLKGKSNLVFIGFMGSGKSMVSKLLGRRLGKNVVSTDSVIEAKEGRSIPEIFETSGEKHFRQLEKQTVKEIAVLENTIIDCGGGVILDQGNIDLLKQKGCLIFLSAGPEFLYRMVKDQTHRPLINVKDPLKRIEAILKERQSKYEQADITIISEDRTIEQICDEILELIKND